MPPRKKKRFSEWLKAQGVPVQALPAIAPVEAEKARHTPPPIGQDAALSPQARLFLEYAKAVNAERYRVTAIKMGKNGEKKVMILDKKDGQSLGFTPKELISQMPEILKLAERGENIYYTPLSEEQHHILIDDMSPEKVLQLQKDGFKPAVFLETSPDNFQCILTFPKFQVNFDRQVGNHLASALNKRYGDPNLSGAIHPHRAPGFENRKPKHEREDGTFPRVSLRWAVRQACKQALFEARKIEQALVAAQQREQEATYLSPISAHGPGSSQQAYFKHWADIRTHITVEDFSRVDAMIALRLRSNGHSQEEVEETIRACAPMIRESQAGRNWQRYAERTTAYAFGYAGDRDMARNARYREQWRRVEGQEAPEQRCRMRF